MNESSCKMLLKRECELFASVFSFFSLLNVCVCDLLTAGFVLVSCLQTSMIGLKARSGY